MRIDWKAGWLAVGILLLSACRPAVVLPPAPGRAPETAPVPRPPEAVDDELRRRDQVASALTEQGRTQLTAGRVDAAMRLFEQAIGQAPQFGPAYYYLAECWFRKGSSTQAYAFHGQADLYLPDDPSWRERLRRQKKAFDQRFSALTIP